MTNVGYELEGIGQLYRDRCDCENGFDELKNQWGWGGFTTQDMHSSQITARAVALVYNWWSWYVRAANPQARREALTSRPLLLAAVGRAVNHSGQTMLYLTPLHAESGHIKSMIANVHAAINHVRRAAEQLPKLNRWATLLAAGKTWGNAVIKWTDAETRSDSELLSLRKFGVNFPDRLLTAVTPEAIDEALKFCKTAGTYTRYRTTINAILHLSDISLKLISKRDKKRKTREWVTSAQWAKLLAELPPHMKPMATFAVETGLRQANVLGLKWSRVDLTRKIVWVEAEDMKADQALSVPLSKGAASVLETQRNSKFSNDEFVFTYRGKPISEIKTAYQAACVRAGVGRLLDGKYSGFTWHGLRHTWATWHAQNGTPLDVLQKLGGWSDLRMVMNYAHHSPSHLASFADNTTREK